MTADAKIGLLLGLMFIVIIAFLLNGLPDFLQEGSEGIIETAITPSPTSYNTANMEEAARNVRDYEPSPLRQVTPPQESQMVASFTSGQPVVHPEPQPVVSLPAAESRAPQVIELPSAQPSYTTASAVNYAAVSQPSRRVHIVQKGESLAAIAVKYYGSEAGNRRATIQRLYEANRSVLESPDKIRVNDELTIPEASLMADSTSPSVSTTQTFLNRHADVFEPASGTQALAAPATRSAARVKEYTVQNGDRLWDIAEQFLGDGKRYNEIVRLNKLDDPDRVPAGTKLRIPSR